MSLNAGSITVSTPGPLGSFAITTTVVNGDDFDLLRVTFDLSGTMSVTGQQLVIDNFGASGGVPPPGGTASYFQANPLGSGFSTFGFSFTSFNNGESFSFSWDPDIPSASSYGAVVSETAGAKVTLITAGGTVDGVMQIVGDSVTVTIGSPVPSLPHSRSCAVAFWHSWQSFLSGPKHSLQPCL